jgi:uncharacterized membrane protein HdeD (DUF308 family)
MVRESALALEARSKWALILAAILIALGLLAVAAPFFASVGAAVVLAWLLVIDGVGQLVYAFRSKNVGRVMWKSVVACLYLGAGIWLLRHPLVGLAGLTLLLTVFFLAEGIADIVGYFFYRKRGASRWMLLDGIITMILAVMIWRHWPSSSMWAIGTLLGVSMLMTGMTRLMLALAVRRASRPVEINLARPAA